MRLRARNTYVALIALLTAGSSAIVACSSSSSSDDTIAPTDSGPTDSTVTDTGPVVDAGTDSGRPEPSVKLAAGAYSTCALSSASLKCWGQGAEQQLGVPANGPLPPTVVPGITFAPTAISGEYEHYCATDGTHASCWGYNPYLQIGPIQSPDDGGCNSGTGTCSAVPESFGAVVKVVTAFYNTCFLTAAGTVSCMGYGGYGALGTSGDGGPQASPIQVAGISGAVDIEAGADTICVLDGAGAVSCWGDDEYGQFGAPVGDASPPVTGNPGPTPIKIPGLVAKQLAVAPFGACALTTAGGVVCWGYNGRDSTIPGGQLGHDPATDPICTGYPCVTSPTPVPGLTDVREISTGYYNTCAVKNDDTVVCWGINQYGELGSSAATLDGGAGQPWNFNPQPVPGLVDVAHISMGFYHACAVTWAGVVECWGDNSSLQLGVPIADGGATSSATPVQPQGL